MNLIRGNSAADSPNEYSAAAITQNALSISSVGRSWPHVAANSCGHWRSGFILARIQGAASRLK
ncbi:MAG: hypothetical protein RL189_1909 [Pseudomonadota bacterium]